MSEDLKSLLDRIQKDGVDKAEADAQRIIADAKTKAKTIISEAETAAAGKLKQAETEGQAFAERGKVALEQAARDVVISVGDAITGALQAIVKHDVSDALDADTVGTMLAQIVDAYGQADQGTRRIDVLLPEAQQQAVADHFMAKLAGEMRAGIEIKSDSSVVSGFRVSVVNENVQHDFTEPAITAALSELLRPHIADIVKKATEEAASKG